MDGRGYSLTLVLALTVVALVIARRPRRTTTPLPPPNSNPPAAPAAAAAPAASATAPGAALSNVPAALPGTDIVARAMRDLPAGGAADQRAHLDALAAQLSGLGRERAAAVIRDFLARGDDASTQLGFTLGNDGLLTGAPTLRVFLLDLLERLDPVAAAQQAKAILSTPTTADEWAIALRSLARGRPDERELVSAKLRELLQHDAWRVQPSAGWLEAFDVAVHLGGDAFVPELSTMMQSAVGPTINHAAFLALDRLATREPATVLPALLEAPDALAGREASRAGMFARADVQDPGQRLLLERYLTDPNRSVAELEAFAGVYPNANMFVSANLLTPTPATTRDGIVRHDLFALGVVQAWLLDPRFSRVRPQLEKMRTRLVEFTRQAH